MFDISDNEDEAVRLLKQIAANTGSIGNGEGEDDTIIQSPRRPLSAGSYLTVETADMDDANDDGTVTLEPGESVAMVRHEARANSLYLLAVGATDAQDVEYFIEVDNTVTVGGVTQSPLGVLNDPFSFVSKLGGAVPAENTVEYIARAKPDASAPVDVAARIHVEEVNR